MIYVCLAVCQKSNKTQCFYESRITSTQDSSVLALINNANTRLLLNSMAWNKLFVKFVCLNVHGEQNKKHFYRICGTSEIMTTLNIIQKIR